MSTEYLVFVAVFAVVLMAASVIVFTEPGQRLMLDAMERIGAHWGLGPWGFLYGFGYEPSMEAVPLPHRAELAETYIIDAERQTLLIARISLWVLIAGFGACVLAAIAIVGILPRLVLSGAWSYETYARAASVVTFGTAAGGIVMGAGLITWIVRRAMHVNCTERCAAARSLVLGAQRFGVSSELAHEFAGGRFPRLRRLLHDVVG